MNILGIETSCDETAAAVVRDGHTILSNVISSQVDHHRPYGGVVPEIASRQHLAFITEVVTQALDQAGLWFDDLDAIAVTQGPGLAPSLLIGLHAACGMACSTRKPILGINHLEAHLYSPILTTTLPDDRDQLFPLISIIVSGGHTILAHATAIGQHHVLGQTKDDAAGEAFDKVAKLLGLGYPGGPEIDRLAATGNPAAIAFPRSMLDDPSHQFSFSGLKTSVLYHIRRSYHIDRLQPGQLSPTDLANLCASFQEAVVDVLVGKTIRAARLHNVRNIAASGGVSINRRFRQKLAAACQQRHYRLHLAPADLCTDNAAMIAGLAYYKLKANPTGQHLADITPSIGLPDTQFIGRHTASQLP